MARTFPPRPRTHRMITRSMKPAKVIEPISAFKAHAVNLIIGNHFRQENEHYRLENRIVWDRMQHLEEMNQVQATRLSRQEQLLHIANRNAAMQHEELAWFDNILHEILEQDAHLRWLLRDRITYSDLPLYDPDEPTPSQASTVEEVDEDYENRLLEDDLQAQMEADMF